MEVNEGGEGGGEGEGERGMWVAHGESREKGICDVL